jgi:hypothetical protein
MLPFHFFQNHRFAHAAIPIEEHARHSGAGRIVESALEFLDGDSGARVSNPARRLHRQNPGFGIIASQFARRRRKM